jgi:DNA-binding transcriptional MerR regulator
MTVPKFLGLPIKRIREVLTGKTQALRPALTLQLWALDEKRRRLRLAIQVIREAQQILDSGHQPDSLLFRKILEVMEMQNTNDWMMKYYDEEARVEVEDRKKLWSADPAIDSFISF